MKTSIRAVALAAIFARLLSTLAIGEDFKLDDWQFTWRYKSVGNVSVDLHTEGLSGALAVYLVKNKDSISRDFIAMSPDNAVKVGNVLSTVDEKFEKQNSTAGDASEKVQVGDIEVFFFKTAKTGFYVDLSENGAFRSVILDRKSAREVAEFLKATPSAAKYMKSKIAF